MEMVVVERSFDQPLEENAMSEASARAAWCREMYGVRFLRSYMSGDRKRFICVYEAPDAEAVRKVQATGGLPYDRVWSASMLLPDREG